MPEAATLFDWAERREAPACETLGEVLATVEAAPGLVPTRRRDLRSALKRLAELTRRALDDIPADPRAIATVLTELDSDGSGLTGKTRRNLGSNLQVALRLAGVLPEGGNALLGCWQALHGELPSRRLQHGLSRLCRFASERGLQPAGLRDSDLDDFIVYLGRATLLTDTQLRDLRRKVPTLWNEAAGALPSWQLAGMTVPEHRKLPRSPLLNAYPQTFQAEVARHCAWLAGETFLEDPPPRLQKSSTIRLRREQIRLAAGALVRSGCPIEEITGLPVLVTPANLRTIAEIYFADKGNRVTAFLRDLMSALISIARHWVKTDTQTLTELKTLRRRLGTTPIGLTPKNRALIRRFDDPMVRARLYGLPGKLMAEARKGGGARGATKAQFAFAIALLTYIPLRVSNLVALRIDEHLVRHGGGWRLYLQPEAVKNGEPLMFRLPEPVARLLEAYLKHHRPLLPHPEARSLFPGAQDGQAKQATTLSDQIQKAIARHLGFKMTAHQFRHLAAKLYLDRIPGDYVSVQQLLGHRNLATTMAFYAGLRTEQAGIAYAEMLEVDRSAAAARSHRRRERR